MPPLEAAISYSGSKLQFYTKQECEQWLSGRERVKPDEDPENGVERFPYPERRSFYYVAHWIATQLTYRMPTLVWMKEWDIWKSGENLHLYYKLRQSYGDHRLLHEAPGHLFLKHEAEDLVSDSLAICGSAFEFSHRLLRAGLFRFRRSATGVSLYRIRSQEFANAGKTFLIFRVEIEVLIVTEKGIHIIRVRQDVSTPAVQHRNLQKGTDYERTPTRHRQSRRARTRSRARA
jgi:hypothetical protein